MYVISKGGGRFGGGSKENWKNDCSLGTHSSDDSRKGQNAYGKQVKCMTLLSSHTYTELDAIECHHCKKSIFQVGLTAEESNWMPVMLAPRIWNSTCSWDQTSTCECEHIKTRMYAHKTTQWGHMWRHVLGIKKLHSNPHLHALWSQQHEHITLVSLPALSITPLHLRAVLTIETDRKFSY